MLPQGIIFNIMRFATHDGPGIRTAVFFKGCPLDCWWCHNPESRSFAPEVLYSAADCRLCLKCLEVCPHHAIEQVDGGIRTTAACRICGTCLPHCGSEARQIAGRRIGLAEAIQEIEKDVVFFEESGGGVTLSGGEPLAQPGFASALLRECRLRGIHSVLETCGYARPDVFLGVATLASLVLFDLKIMDADLHRHYTGVSCEQIQANLEALIALGHPLVVRIPVVPGVNDSEAEIGRFAAYLGRLRPPRVELLPYQGLGAGKYPRLGAVYRMAATVSPDSQDLARFAGALAAAGVAVSYGGSND
jgi:pyruvate formate lyase activating enzyme